MPDEALFSRADRSQSKRQQREASPNGTGGGVSGVEPAALLPASRRVDWRFLLPDPRLGRVLCLGPAPQTLVASLKIFSGSLAVVASATDEMADALFDVLVACDPPSPAVTDAARFVRPGGFVYFEMHGPLSMLRGATRASGRAAFSKNGLSGPQNVARRLGAAGFQDVGLTWHWPDFETCKMMIPLDEPAAALSIFARGGWGLKAQVGRVLGKLLAGSGFLPWIAPCVSVLGRRGGA